MQKSGPCGARLFRNPRRTLENYEGDHVLIHWTGNGTYAERLATVTGETIPQTRRRVWMSGALCIFPSTLHLACRIRMPRF
jgi:hypothetical protein